MAKSNRMGKKVSLKTSNGEKIGTRPRPYRYEPGNSRLQRQVRQGRHAGAGIVHPALPPGLEDELARINSMVGEEFKVYEIDEYGHAWVEKWWETGPDKKISHSLALGSNDMERVDV